VETEKGEGQITSYSYDQNGNLTRKTAPGNRGTFTGGIIWEFLSWADDSLRDISADLEGIIGSYNPSKSCKQVCGDPKCP